MGAEPRTGSLAGTVLDTSGRPLAHACVAAASAQTAFPALTDATGRYMFAALPPGRYTLAFSGCAAGQYRTQWSGGALTAAGARPVRVAAGAAVTVPPARLARLSAEPPASRSAALTLARANGATVRTAPAGPLGISGVVRNAAGRELAGACVLLTGGAQSSTSGGVVSEDQEDELTFTDAHGRYTSGPLSPGRWQVMFSGCQVSGNYAPQWWRDKPSARHATWLRIGTRTRDEHVNVTMHAGGTIVGVLASAAAPHPPLSGFCVDVQGTGSLAQVVAEATTNSQGQYRFTDLGTGRYQLDAYPCGDTENENFVEAERYASARDGRTMQAGSFELEPGAVISGIVTRSGAGGGALGGICVSVIPDSLAELRQRPPWAAVTAADGSYSIQQLPAGRYFVAFDNCSNGGSFASVYYDGGAAGTESSAQARTLTLATAQPATAGARMPPGAIVSGSVTGPGGKPLSGVCVNLLAPAAAAGASSDSVAAELYYFSSYGAIAATRNGAYRLRNITPGRYLAQFYTAQDRFSTCGNRGNYGWQWFRRKPAFGQAQEISAGPGKTTGISAALATGGTITGRITSRSGQPVRNVCVLVTGANGLTDYSPVQFPTPVSGASGRYRVRDLPAGRYSLTFSPSCDAVQGYLPTAYRNGATVGVRTGKVTAGVDAVLRPAGSGSLAGLVRSAVTGKPVADWCVAASQSNPLLVGYGFTNAQGRYRIAGLVPGRYRVQIFPCGPGTSSLAPQQRAGVLVSSHTTASVNARLRAGGRVTGTITSGAPAAPAPGVCVEATPVTGAGQPAVAVTNAAGSYTLSGLAAGRYRLQITADCPYGAGPLAPAGRSVSVRLGATSAGVNAMLLADGGIAGTVNGPGAVQLSGICVAAYPLRGGPTVAAVSANGSYQIGDLPPGGYRVEFAAGCGATGYVSRWWQDAASAATATPVSVSADATTAGIDAQLART